METIVFNLNGTTRRVRENGVDYIVVPMTTITPNGVLPGSKGSLFYPSQETQNSLDSWNDIPIVVYHPEKNGQHCSAQDVPEKHIGSLRNSEWNATKGLQHEGWLEVNALRKADAWLRQQGKPEILPNILNGQPIEVSTGLYTTNITAPGGYAMSPKGRPYTAVATQFVPDHLAVLPDQVGACSNNDGCGLLVNERKDASYVINDEVKPDNCSCPNWPNVKLRNGSTHMPECPVHKEWKAAGGFGNWGKKTVSNTLTWNEWSDAARQASIMARQASATARKASVKASSPKNAELGRRTFGNDHSKNALSRADQAIEAAEQGKGKSSPLGQDLFHRQASLQHGLAAREHDRTADSAMAQGKFGLWKLHKDAAESHRNAQTVHEQAEKSVTNTLNSNPEGHNQYTHSVGPNKTPLGQAHPSTFTDEQKAKSEGTPELKQWRDAVQAHKDTVGSGVGMRTITKAREKLQTAHKALQAKVKEPTGNQRRNNDMSDKGWLRRLGEAMGIVSNAGERHPQTGQWMESAKTAAKRGAVSQQHRANTGSAYSDYDDENAPAQGEGADNKPGDDGRDTMLGHREDIDLDGDGDGPVDDDAWRKQDEEAEHTEEPVSQPGNRKGDAVGNKKRMTNEDKCPECGGEMEDGRCEDCGWEEDDDDATENANPEGHNQYTVSCEHPARGKMPSHVDKTIVTAKSENDAAEQAKKLHQQASGHEVKILKVEKGLSRNQLTANQLDNIWITYNRNWPRSKRDKMDDSDFAGPDQSFPITTQEDLDAAVHSIGRSKHPAGVIKAGIKRVAKRKGLDLPDSMVGNANPEGVNQYTNRGAAALSKKAHEASKSALNFGGESSKVYHENAAYAHRTSAAALTASDKKSMASAKLYHSDAAKEHSAAAKHEEDMGYKDAAAVHEKAAQAHQSAADYRKQLSNNAFGQPNKVKPVKGVQAGSAQAVADTDSYKTQLGGVQGMVTNCPKCGGKLTDNACECGFTKNSLSVTTPPAPVGGGMVMGQDSGQNPMAHAASQQAAVASMDHPPARKPAISAFDHSAAGRDDKAAQRHGEAADAHDDAAQESYGSGNVQDGDDHMNAAALHRKAAAMHSVDPTNMVGNENNGPYSPGQFAMMDKAADESTSHAKSASANADKMRTASSHAAAADAHRHAAKANKAKGDEEQASVHMAQAKVHAKKYKETGGKGKATLNHGTTNMKVLNGLNGQQRAAKLKELRPQMLKSLTANCSCANERKGLQLLNNETLAKLVVANAKAQGSNADAMGSGDFDDADNAGGWDKSRVKGDDETLYDNEDDADETEDDAEKEPMNTGGGSDKTRGRVGVSNRSYSREQWMAMAPPEVREEHRMVANVLRQQKVNVIRRLVGHLPRDRQDFIVNRMGLLKKSLEELQAMTMFQPPQQEQTVNAYEGLERPDPVYLGGNDVPIHNERKVVENADQNDIQCLVPPTINFKQWADEDRMARNGGHGVGYNNGADSAMRKEHLSAESAM